MLNILLLYFQNFALTYKIGFGNIRFCNGIESAFDLAEIPETTSLQDGRCDHAAIASRTMHEKGFVWIDVFYPIVDIG